ncbi:uncharacterized protein LOC128531790 [Clarias gariepinus]|uniref:uncharacterized protein LOC128531790 n=1 Tax=Clarias gariepinus TaxID=13013 RepID=UPI00234E0CE4|nr:uncharacterized protein LOC128531790 [Clarias gariepinus]
MNLVYLLQLDVNPFLKTSLGLNDSASRKKKEATIYILLMWNHQMKPCTTVVFKDFPKLLEKEHFCQLKSSVLDSVPAGASVTLQCSVLSESRAAELQVLWFRAAPPQSHPQIIYTHHNSSHQCESGSSTHTCVYNFSKNILSLNDTGTYYCAVAVCGKIIFGNGTQTPLGLEMLMLLWTTLLVFNKIDSGRCNDIHQPNPLITADVGENVILHCFRLGNETVGSIVWYKQKIGHEPCLFVTVGRKSIFEKQFRSQRFSIKEEERGYHLHIAHVEPSDEAMYYCGVQRFSQTFGKGTFLSVKGKPDLSVSVFQSGVLDSVPAGASVTLQCSVLSESRAAELQVLWFRAAPPQSHPQIIYTHHNSSHQCESGSSTHTCVYNFSKNILSLSDTGTYYCAVATCGKIIFGNGTRVQLDVNTLTDQHLLICLAVALALCVVMNFVQLILSCKKQEFDLQHVIRQQGSIIQVTIQQRDCDAVKMNYASINFNKSERAKRKQPQDSVYSEVLYTSVT